MDHRKEYKNAMNLFTEKKFTPAHREATEKVGQSLFTQLVRGIAERRKIDEAAVRALVDRGPLIGKEVLDAKLVDGLGYREQVYDQVKKRAGDGAKMLYVAKYRERAGSPWKDGAKKIALIYGVGGVARGKSEYSALSGDANMGSDTVTGAFRAAIADEDVKAIVFRIDSPGGSYVASDAIWQEVVRARKAGKPVIATMARVAGSGGYFVAMAADKIVAQPGTITGSIGVLGGKMITRDLWGDHLGISFDDVRIGANATQWSSLHEYSDAEWKRFQALLDRIYDDFTSKVAEGRKLPKEKVLEIAKGRIWTGEDAKAIGLVDELGGFPKAIALARTAAGIPEGEKAKIVLFPPPKTVEQAVVDALRGREPDSSDEAGKSAVALARELEALRPVVRTLRASGLLGDPGVLAMPPVTIE
jgi:protease-4